MGSDRKICVGMIAEPHGVRGLMRLRSFTEDPDAIMAYGTLTDETGKRAFPVEIKSAAKNYLVAALKGVTTREAAVELRGTRLYVDRAVLPKTRKQEYYEADLIGLKAHDKKGTACGMVMAIHNHGAGVFLEIGKTKRDSFMLPFTDVYVPEVDLKSGHIIIEPPEGWLHEEKPEGKTTKPRKEQGAGNPGRA